MDIQRLKELSGQRCLFEDDSDELPNLPIGKHNDVPDSEFDADQLAKGVEIEMEHTDDPALAKAIAKDHLSSLADYYTRLEAMIERFEKHEPDDDADDTEK